MLHNIYICTMSNPPKKGGSRKGAGRHPVEDKKVPFTVYPRQSWIDKFDKDTLKQMVVNFIEKEFKKVSKNK